MRYLIDNHEMKDPCVNLALEEYCLKNLDAQHDYFILYANNPSVIVGRNQNILQEINRRFTQEHRMQVVRRLSGGGAVYHDKGNLNFSFIQNTGSEGLRKISHFIEPVRAALHRMGVSAHINDRNDLLFGTKKISGCARFSNTRHLMIHGTLLFDADLQVLQRALSPPTCPMLTKAIQSVRHPVTNIRPLLDRSMDMTGFRNRFLALVSKEVGGMQALSLDDRQWKQIFRLAADKYRSWDWTFGRTPDFSVIRNEKDGDRLRIDVHRGKIAGISDLDPHSGSGMWRAVEQRLTGTRYERDEIRKALDGMQMDGGDRRLEAEQLANDLCFN